VQAFQRERRQVASFVLHAAKNDPTSATATCSASSELPAQYPSTTGGHSTSDWLSWWSIAETEQCHFLLNKSIEFWHSKLSRMNGSLDSSIETESCGSRSFWHCSPQTPPRAQPGLLSFLISAVFCRTFSFLLSCCLGWFVANEWLKCRSVQSVRDSEHKNKNALSDFLTWHCLIFGSDTTISPWSRMLTA